VAQRKVDGGRLGLQAMILSRSSEDLWVYESGQLDWVTPFRRRGDSMHAVLIHETGSPDVLHYEEVFGIAAGGRYAEFATTQQA
jgi:hypothetical protein